MSPQPQPTQQQSRIDLADLKGQIVKKIGQDRALSYFSYLNRLLSQKLGKTEFDKLCRLTLGRENLPLHNQLIQSILKNACHGRVPPPIPKRVSKPVRVIGKRSPLKDDGCLSIGAISSMTPNSTLTIGSNEDALPLSPCEFGSGICDQRPRDAQSEAFGTNGKASFTSHQPRSNKEALGKSVAENGDPYPCDLQRPMQHHQGLAEQPAGKWDVSLPSPNKMPQIKWSPHEQYPVHSKGSGAIIVCKDGEEMNQNNSANSGRIVLQAPLGISFCHANRDGACRALPVASSSSTSSRVTNFVDSGQLSDTETLRKRMEQIVGAAGLDGVTLDCANLLNNCLDVYLKRLITSCIELVGARSGHAPIKHSVYNQQLHRKLINGVTPGYQMHLQSSSGILGLTKGEKSHRPISFLDFKVAMELNTQQLGQDWPRLLEKICLHAWEE
eukprot:TRINITY_DN34991_c0_g1_i1.p1 TRINITY_DN34991_c0_g1~~TRINITY_DN34991_c0_g1_i1.p1  ORF type:complete len:442 (+),score=81.85 TRINITY_DN34991_c0_g1_i1:818-2143(+)